MTGQLQEKWRPVGGYEGLYEVSNLGNVRSLRAGGPRPVSRWFNEDGYPKVHLSNGRKQANLLVHRLVAKAFFGEKENVLHNEVAHLDGDRANARSDNLKWVSKVENHSHKRLHGTHRLSHSILSMGVATLIRQRDGTAKELGRRYGVSAHAVYDIWQGKSWSEASIRGKE